MKINRQSLASALLILTGVHCGPAIALDPAQRFGDYVRDQWGLAEGLPQVSALSVVQDDTGYIWVGTQNGIARFDGVRFQSFDRVAVGHPVTMVHVSLRGRDGLLWFGTDRGIVRYDGRSFTAFDTRPAPLPTLALAQTADGTIIAGTAAGIVRIDGTQVTVTALEGESVGALAIAPDGTWWAGVKGAVVRIGPQGATRFALPQTAQVAVSELVLEDRRVWIGTQSGLFVLDPDQNMVAAAPGEPGSSAIQSLLLDRNGSLWIGSALALFRRDPSGKLTRHADGDFIANPWVTALYEDRDGNLWVGGERDSLFRLWNGWVSRITTLDGLTDPLAWSVVTDPSGRLVIGTNSNVMVREASGMRTLVDGAALPNPAAYELSYDRRGRLWIGTRAGLARLDAPGTAPVVIEDIGRPQVNVVVEGETDQIWIGTSNGLFRWDHAAAVRVGPNQVGPSNGVRAILPLSKDRALIGTEAGAFIVDGSQWSAPDWAQPIASEFVTSIARIDADLIVITTLDSGFGVLIDDRLVMIGKADGLPSSNIFSARRVRDALFLSSANGAFSLPLSALRERSRSPAARIDWRVPLSISGTLRGSVRTRCCNGGARARALLDGSRIWYPTLEGALSIDLDRLQVLAETPTVVIESVRAAGAADATPIDRLVSIERSPRDLAIGFTALAFRDPRGLRFEYQLLGYDQDWIDSGARREAFYTNLPPGQYTFRVRAESSARLWSERDASVQIEVLPRWHERTAVRIAMLAALGLILGMLVLIATRWRTRAYQRRQQELEGIVAERTQELARANTRLRDANRSLAQENQTDELTNLRNRRWVLEHLSEWLQQASAERGPESCSVFALFDLDHFKRMNDRYGHVGGDQLLMQFAQLLLRLVGEQGTVVRWGGEEFLVLLRDVPRALARERIDQVWRQALEHIHRAPDGKPMVLTSSVGYSLYPPVPSAPRAVPWTITLELADAATFQVKQHARNAWAGLLVVAGSDPQLLAAGVAGRLATLIGDGVLVWDNIKPRYGTPLDGRTR